MLCNKITIACALLIALVNSGTATEYWTKVNGGYPLDSDGNVKADFGVVTSARGDLVYIYNCDRMGPVMGRFRASASGESRKWEVYSDGQWASNSEAIPTSISATTANYDAPINLFAVPGDGNEDSIIGVANVDTKFSTLSMDMHGYAANIQYEEGIGWSQWKSGTTYGPYHITPLVPSWRSSRGDFAVWDWIDEEDWALTGIVVAVKGHTLPTSHFRPQLTATKYDHQDNSNKWHRWNNPEGGASGWNGNNSWPDGSWNSANAARDTFVLDRSADTIREQFGRYPQIAHLGGGDYLVVFGYETYADAEAENPDDSITSAAKYCDGVNPAWKWWNGSDWEEGGDYNYGAIVGTNVCEAPTVAAPVELLATDPHKASLFYKVLDSSSPDYRKMCEITYEEDETGANPAWSAAETLGHVIDNFCVVLAGDNRTIWLYYVSYGQYQREVYLRKKTVQGWSPPDKIYESETNVKVVGASFVSGDPEVPICFIAETGGEKHLYAISDYSTESTLYWADEKPLALTGTPEMKELDTRITWENQVLNDTPESAYSGGCPASLGLDEDGYLYAPGSHACHMIVHNNELDPDEAHTWGGTWDYLHMPGGASVDNVGGKVYVGSHLIDKY
ncbi:MAG: hypothetical protein ACYS8Z_10720, partial [Planctomycetota bacterium]